jgi:hypothetical protein
MNDYSDLCIALQKQLRMVFESANENKYDKAIEEAQFLDALSGLLVQELRKKGK